RQLSALGRHYVLWRSSYFLFLWGEAQPPKPEIRPFQLEVAPLDPSDHLCALPGVDTLALFIFWGRRFFVVVGGVLSGGASFHGVFLCCYGFDCRRQLARGYLQRQCVQHHRYIYHPALDAAIP